MTATLTSQQVATMHRALHGFGYTDLRYDDVRIAAESIAVGKKPEGIIGLFVQKFMRDAGILS